MFLRWDLLVDKKFLILKKKSLMRVGLPDQQVLGTHISNVLSNSIIKATTCNFLTWVLEDKLKSNSLAS